MRLHKALKQAKREDGTWRRIRQVKGLMVTPWFTPDQPHYSEVDILEGDYEVEPDEPREYTLAEIWQFPVRTEFLAHRKGVEDGRSVIITRGTDGRKELHLLDDTFMRLYMDEQWAGPEASYRIVTP